MSRSTCVFLSLALAFVTCAHGQPTQEKLDEVNATDTVNRIAKLHDAWGAGLNSPNASISLTEISRVQGVIKYRLFAKGLPHDRTYVLVSWPVTQLRPIENLNGVTLDESGQAICAGKPWDTRETG